MRRQEGLPYGDSEQPQFSEPWQATVFAIVLELRAKGVFGWPEWGEAMSTDLVRFPGAPDDQDSILYSRWLMALECLIADRGLLTEAEISDRQEAWRQAYLATPHGQPIELDSVNRCR